MALDLSPESLVRSGSGLLFVLLGLFILLLRPRPRFAFGYAVFLLAFGARFVFRNIGKGSDQEAGFIYAALACALVAAVALVPRTAAQVRTLSITGRRHFVAAAAAVGLLDVAAAALLLANRATYARMVRLQDSSATAFGFEAAGFALMFGSVTIAMLAAALSARERGSTARPAFFAAYAFGLWVVASSGYDLMTVRSSWPLVVAMAASEVVPSLMALAFCLRLPDPVMRRTAHAFAMVLLLAATALTTFRAVTYNPSAPGIGPQDYGMLGVARILSFALLAWAVFRLGSLGVPMKQWTLRTGSLAAVALAALLITAQITQNFLQATYGLYIGGVVAGVAVFAAFPLQRAAERAMEKRRHGTASGPASIYRKQVETAWQDGRLGANERMMLHELQLQLGVSAEDAQQIDRDVATQHVRAKQPGKAVKRGV